MEPQHNVTCLNVAYNTVYEGRLLSQAPTSSYKTPTYVLQSGLRRAQLQDRQSKITVKYAWLLRIHRFDLRVGRMTAPNTTTHVRRGVGNSKFESCALRSTQ